MAFTKDCEYKNVREIIAKNKFFSTKRNNELYSKFLDAKESGGYGRIVYDDNTLKPSTLIKKLRCMSKIDKFFKKDFDKITETELLVFRDKLNNNEIKKEHPFINIQRDNSGKIISRSFDIRTVDKPLEYNYKRSLAKELKEFYLFLIEYLRIEEKKDIENITKFFKIKKPEDHSEVNVQFIPDNEVHILLDNIKNRNFRALVQLSLMSGARPIEIINLRYGQGRNLYKQNNKWVVHLAKMKKVSYKKYPFVVDMYEDELYPYFDRLNLKDNDLVFKITSETFRKLMKHYTSKYIGKTYSPKILRKTARMIRSNAGYSHDWINKLMGHSPNSAVQSHYTNYAGLDDEPDANERLKGKQYPSLKSDYERLKLEMQAMKQQQTQILRMIAKNVEKRKEKT